MKLILLAACILGVVICAPTEMFMEFDIRHAPSQTAQAVLAAAPVGTLEVLLPVDNQKRLIGGRVQGFIKQEIIEGNGRESKDVFYPLTFDLPDPALAAPAAPVAPAVPLAPAAPAAPVAPVAPAAPVAPVAPAAPVAPVAPVAPAAPVAPVAPAAPTVPIIAAARPGGDDDDDEEDDD